MQFAKSFFALAVGLAWGGACAAAQDVHPGAHAHSPPDLHTAKPKTSALPARKSGLWEVRVRKDDLAGPRQGPQASRAPATVLQCTSPEAEPAMLLAVVPGQEDCSAPRVASRRGAGRERTYDVSTVCYVHDNRVNARITLSGDLQSAYRGTFDVQYARTPQHDTGPMVFEGRWLGACQAGQRPGDMVLPNGVTVNVVDDLQRAQHQGHQDHQGHRH